MSAEAWIALLSLLLSGLCFVLWNTNGELDWIATILGCLMMTGAIVATSYNAGVGASADKAMHVFAKVGVPDIKGALTQIDSVRVSSVATLMAVCVGAFLLMLPIFLRFARAARR